LIRFPHRRVSYKITNTRKSCPLQRRKKRLFLILTYSDIHLRITLGQRLTWFREGPTGIHHILDLHGDSRTNFPTTVGSIFRSHNNERKINALTYPDTLVLYQ